MAEQQMERKDAWKPEEDRFLAETVLKHIREGSTQLKAFEEVGERLDRTSAACGFRWNSSIRKLYEKEVKEAKGLRKSGSYGRMTKAPVAERSYVSAVVSSSLLEDENPFDRISSIASQSRDLIEQLNLQIQRLNRQLDEKNREIEALQNQLLSSRKPEETLSEDYQSFLKILDNARKLGILDRQQKVV